jgi:hypothetical protein
LVLAAWAELLLVVVVLQMVRILFFLQSHLLGGARVALAVVLPQVLLVAPVEAQAAIQVPLVVLATHHQHLHLKEIMVAMERVLTETLIKAVEQQ